MREMTLRVVLMSGLIAMLTACGGGSDSGSDTYTDAYLQFYNGSANSPSTLIIVDGDDLGSSTYGDVTSLFSLESGSVDLELQWQDGDGQEITVAEQTVSLKDGYKTLMVMSGDFDNPDVTEYQFERSEFDDEFALYAVSVISDGQSFDLYIADSGAPFSEAHFISTLSYLSFEQGQYWDADDNLNAWSEGDYVIYLTAPGSDEVLFQSQEIDFAYSTDYVLIVRNTTGANEDNIVIDIVLNSSSIEANQDVTATSQFRVYSALSQSVDLDVSLHANGDDELQQTISGGQMSEFTSVTFGDYQVQAYNSEDSSYGFSNRLLTLNQGESKTLLLFENENAQLTSIEVSDSSLPQSFEHEVNVANLLPEFDNVNVYFVRNDETIDSADYKMTSLDYADARTITLPNDYYSILVVYVDSLGEDTLLYRSALMDFTGENVLLVTIEAESEDEWTSGYRAKLLQ